MQGKWDLLQRLISGFASIAASYVMLVGAGIINPTSLMFVYQPSQDEIPEELLK